MKKILGIILSSAFLFAIATTVSAAENWELVAPSGIDFVCGGTTYGHTLNVVTNNPNGSFEGTGIYNPNTGYTWDMAGEINGNDIDFNVLYTGINSGYTLNGIGTIAPDGSINGTTDGNCQTFSMVAGSAVFNRRAEITSPDEGENVWGDVTFAAYLVDNDADGIQWAVREGTCAAGTNTVFGNVDGHTDAATIDQSDLYNQTFEFAEDMTGMTQGMYCFIYNPREDSGESKIRLTRQFFVENPDSDGDGMLDVDEKSMCLGTNPDDDFIDQAANRWSWRNGDWGYVSPKTKEWTPGEMTMEDTYGCSCEQILDSMSEATGLDFGGHYKFGCSKSILEDWNRGTYYLGPTFLETVEIYSNGLSSQSSEILASGKEYFLAAKGTYRFANWGDYGIADAEYAYRNDSYSLPNLDGWTLGEDNYPSILGLDAQVDNTNVFWGDYNPEHEYTIDYSGNDSVVSFHIYDSYYGDNSGSLFVDIVEDKWVDL